MRPLFILCALISLLLYSCSTGPYIPDPRYEHSAFRKKKNSKKLVIWDYPDSIFPNSKILEYPSLEKLVVHSNVYWSFIKAPNKKHHLRIDTVKLKQLRSLKVLSLDFFEFDHFPHELAGIDSLHTLSVMFSNLDNTIGIEKFSNLRALYLNGNALTGLDGDLSKLVKLKELSLCNNKFLQVPLNILDVPNIERLNLSNIEAFDKYFNSNAINWNIRSDELKSVVGKASLQKVYIDAVDIREKEVLITALHKKEYWEKVRVRESENTFIKYHKLSRFAHTLP